ncbi:hypothetical protein RO3G_17306 [Rhizopus delemar RA 99-880]|uniref:Uncharacterized protein n=1 Tax=Rhizopus delemar (strain RA 99-880 / ATCC MYA-4621 / FGSC 9543 / NRRL 43880) TaxID=246409 RepID=I1CVW5_RHIO9|nr:hypothetical protein RO3G_17306 [Rhizopus delemar RA 99-880]|eukprot:EIE92595.1 hypothetical protein RO3G_17306 [Rhizopus delemar RA 99-880]
MEVQCNNRKIKDNFPKPFPGTNYQVSIKLNLYIYNEDNLLQGTCLACVLRELYQKIQG